MASPFHVAPVMLKHEPKFVNPENSIIEFVDDNEKMEATYQSLTDVPPKFFMGEYKTTLRMINLSNNDFKNFPLELLQLENLVILKLDHNKIQFLPK